MNSYVFQLRSFVLEEGFNVCNIWNDTGTRSFAKEKKKSRKIQGW